MEFYEIGFIQCMKDFSNFFKFKKMMKKESLNKDSKFNKYKLHNNWLGNIVYVQIDCTDEDLMNANYDADYMLKLKLKPIIEYLSTELDWGDYLNLQVSNFVDEDGNSSLSYAVLFLFNGYRLTFSKFLMNCIVSIVLLGGITYSFLKLF